MNKKLESRLDGLREKYNRDYGVKGMKWGHHKPKEAEETTSKRTKKETPSAPKGIENSVKSVTDGISGNSSYVKKFLTPERIGAHFEWFVEDGHDMTDPKNIKRYLDAVNFCDEFVDEYSVYEYPDDDSDWYSGWSTRDLDKDEMAGTVIDIMSEEIDLSIEDDEEFLKSTRKLIEGIAEAVQDDMGHTPEEPYEPNWDKPWEKWDDEWDDEREW